jgi:hypothetical protein
VTILDIGFCPSRRPERLLLGAARRSWAAPSQDDLAFARFIAATPVALQSFTVE